MSGSVAAPRAGLPRWLEAPVAGTVLVLLSPILLFLAAAVLASSGRPVLFRQTRVGRAGRPFVMLKLRTMRPTSTGPSITAASDSRITAIGRLLRRLKLDEVPQLWNVLRGDMSLVGPRPEVPGWVDLDDHRWRAVLTARPGLADPVTLELRHEERLLAEVGDDWPDFYRNVLLPYKLAGYLAYLEGRTWQRDVGVLARTVAASLLPRIDPTPSAEQLRQQVAER